MADFSKTIQIVIDTTVGNAKKGFSDLKSSVGDAEGGLGKFKAAASGVGDIVGSLPLPAMAGAALGAAAAIKGLGDKFTGAALEAKKMSDATGLNVESSSEWIAAADDVGLSADTISSAFGKATKALGTAPAKFEELGVSIAHTKDGAVDMNATLLNAIDTIKNTDDPTKKAALASQLFGKSWAELTPLIDQGGDALRDTMKATSEAQRVTDDEVKSAKEWQASMDNLGDVVTDLQLSLGKLVVEGMNPTIKAASEMTQQFDDLINSLDGGIGGISKLGEVGAFAFKNLNPIGQAFRAIEVGGWAMGKAVDALEAPFNVTVAAVSELGDELGGLGATARDFISGIGGAGVELQKFDGFITDTHNDLGKHKEATDGAAEGTVSLGKSLRAAGLEEENLKTLTQGTTDVQDAYTASVKASNDALAAEATALDAARTALDAKQQAALGALNSELGYRQAVSGVEDALTKVQTAQAEAEKQTRAHGEASMEAAVAARDLQRAGDDLEGSLLQTAAAAAQLAKDQATASGQAFTTNDSVNAQVRALESLKQKFPELSGGIDEYIAKLKQIPTQINTNVVTAYTETGARRGATPGVSQLEAMGTTNLRRMADGGMVPVHLGEKGPEDVYLPEGSHVVPAQRIRANAINAAREAMASTPLASPINITVNGVTDPGLAAKAILREASWAMRTGTPGGWRR